MKILDFGLAKQLAAPAGEGGTEAGAVMGTPGYMSPEQVRGLPVDHRTDLFSLGVVLYELLSGAPPFVGASSVETLAATLEVEPVLDGVPAAVRPVLARCLEKDPARRFRSAHDLAFALATTPGAPPPATRPPGRGWGRVALTAGLAAMAAAGAIAVAVAVQPARPTSARDATAPSYERLTYRKGFVLGARFAPDGRSVLYSARWAGSASKMTVHSATPATPESPVIPIAREEAQLVSVARTGALAVLVDPDLRVGTLAYVPAAGGVPRELLAGVADADWAPDGKTLAVLRKDGHRAIIEYPIGRVVFSSDHNLSGVRVSPDGERVAFLRHPRFGDSAGEVMVVDRAGEGRSLTRTFGSAGGLAWSPAGDIWFTASDGGDNALRAVTLAGEDRLVVAGPSTLILCDIAADGRVLLIRAQRRRSMRVLAAGAARERDLTWFDWSLVVGISAAGDAVLFGEGAAGRETRAYLRPSDGGDAVWLGDGVPSALSPDGQWAILLPPNAIARGFQLVRTGAGQPRTIPTAPVELRWVRFLPDGLRVLLAGAEPGMEPRTYLLDLAEGGTPRPISPPGWLAYAVSDDGRTAIASRSQHGPGGAILSLVTGQITPIEGLRGAEGVTGFAPGGHVFVLSGNDNLWRLYRLDPATGERELARQLDVADDSVQRIVTTSDGRAYAYSIEEEERDLYIAEGLR